jgi:hypothetical protein
MQFDNLKPAWQQIKLLSTMHPLDATEILSMIEHPESIEKTKLQKGLYTLFMFLVIAIFCQGG